MFLSAKLYLVCRNEYVFGPGRFTLLKKVEEFGSLRKAAIELGMSYRWAWGRIAGAEKALGRPLLIRQKGKSKSGQSSVLSPEGRQLVAWFASTEKKLDKTLEQAYKSLPSCLTAQRDNPNPPAPPLPAPDSVRGTEEETDPGEKTVHLLLSTILRSYVADYDPVAGLHIRLEGETNAEGLARRLNLPLELIKIVMVNGMHAELHTPLADGDRVMFFPAVGGG